jgi:hypothetical protein
MPKDPKKNIDRYKVRGGDINEFEYDQNQEAFAEQKAGAEANLIPGTPPEQKVTKKPAKIVTTKKATKKTAKKKTSVAARGASAKKLAAKKATKKKAATKKTATKKAAKKK